jgi:uncharacterized protein YqgC (DUF456 family)
MAMQLALFGVVVGIALLLAGIGFIVLPLRDARAVQAEPVAVTSSA